jgi:hypothetical protein
MTIRKFMSPDIQSGGGTVLPPSLSDIDPLNQNPQTPTNEPQQQPGNDPQQPVAEGNRSNTTDPAPKDIDGNAGTDGEGGEDSGTNDSGTDNQDNNEPQESFWEVTEKITGRPVQVEYPEGIEPDTPEGAAVREEAVRYQAYGDFEADLRQRDPRGFAYLVHRQNGGTDEEFFGTGHVATLPTQEQFDNSMDVKIAVYRQHLAASDLDDDSIEALVQKAIKENKIDDKAKSSYEKLLAERDRHLADIEATNNTQRESFNRAVDGVYQRLGKGIASDVSIIIPETEREAFREHIMGQLEYDRASNSFRLVQVLDTENLKPQLEAMFYQFKKGDLSKIIQKKSETVAAQRLRLSVEKTKQGGTKSGDTGKSTPRHVPLGEL